MLDFIKGIVSSSSSTTSIYIGFEDVKKWGLVPSANRTEYILINTLSSVDQACLIFGTQPIDKEEAVINEGLNRGHNWTILLYGRNSADDSVLKKRKQLISLGFSRVYIYGGGLFEWLLLQEIYGAGEFPTTSVCRDILRFRAPLLLHTSLPALIYPT